MLAVVTAAVAPALDLCVQNEAGMDARKMMLTVHHLRQYRGELSTDIQVRCSAESVRVTFVGYPGEGHPSDALGATRIAKGRILPEVQIFTKPVQEMLPGARPEVEARALAKVVAHELMHYLQQRAGHLHGLDQPKFDSRTLLAMH
ncbi:MAG: hypothetical protein JST93_31295 [Acidobacteria bacterium]|nr:hypothetical protein [Acidobacteriota bacterium]